MSTNQDEYNGWPNRETWATVLHLSNDEGLYNWCLEVAEEACEQAGEWAEHRDIEPNFARWAGEAIKDQIIDPLFDDPSATPAAVTPDAVAMMWDDIGSLWRVDWDEVGAAFVPEGYEA